MVKLNQKEKRLLEQEFGVVIYHIKTHEGLALRSLKNGNKVECDRHTDICSANRFTLNGMDRMIELLGYIRDWDADHNVKIHKIGE